MALKSCLYRNCENYVNVVDKTYSKENITFFQFPKNPERYLKWMELGKAPAGLPANYYYFCSEHFDKKFLCTGPRRTILVGEALPYPYEQENQQQELVDNISEEYLYHMKEDSIAEQHLEVESTTMQENTDDLIQFISNEISLDNGDTGILDVKELDEAKEGPYSYTREQDSAKLHSSPAKRIKIVKCASLLERRQTSLAKKSPVTGRTDSLAGAYVVNSEQNEIRSQGVSVQPAEKYVSTSPDNSPESLIDSNLVTTFIFKGEEYVQMPKEHYIKEKIGMMNRIKKMENVIATIKRQLSTL